VRLIGLIACEARPKVIKPSEGGPPLGISVVRLDLKVDKMACDYP
jgi:hypothetical protein